MSPEDSDIERWVDQLAGRRRSDVPAGEAAEIARLQRAIERQAQSTPPSAPDEGTELELDEKQAWQKMQFRLRGAGVLSSAPRRRMFWVPMAAAATLLLAVGVALLLRTPADDGIAVALEAPPRYRSDVPIVEVRAGDPLAQAKRLARSIAPHGVEPRVYFHEGRATVEFDLQPAQRAAVERELKALSIPADGLKTGVDRVVFIPR